MSNAFGSRLRELRKDRRLTMREFGEKFGLAESTISGYETGIRNPDMTLIIQFAEFFGVSSDFLLGLDDRDNLPIDKIVEESENSTHKGDAGALDREWVELYDKVKEKGAELEATAILRSASQMSKKKLSALLQVLEFIEKDDD